MLEDDLKDRLTWSSPAAAAMNICCFNLLLSSSFQPEFYARKKKSSPSQVKGGVCNGRWKLLTSREWKWREEWWSLSPSQDPKKNRDRLWSPVDSDVIGIPWMDDILWLQWPKDRVGRPQVANSFFNQKDIIIWRYCHVIPFLHYDDDDDLWRRRILSDDRAGVII